MSETDGSHAAFATPDTQVQGEYCTGRKGLTKEEYFASQAMMGLLARGSIENEDLCSTSVVIARALIRELI